MKVISLIIVTALAASPSAAMGTVSNGGACTTKTDCVDILSQCENGVCKTPTGVLEFAKELSKLENGGSK
ncbi:hypothetical protein N7513_007108 [Penicillium frequentans]|uniref:Extracellular membrane protein CFEM domain-containing protein n=1 Tax=Penicillium frequentans TaxID=3151616 RepID=A0AAD6CMH5_9EURO|nr:hypothetical protein N7494_012846 [Penicillium glabrum]KAJ5544297.1 hypothetical protein N7513_007108 [Penicillium glabrum]